MFLPPNSLRSLVALIVTGSALILTGCWGSDPAPEAQVPTLVVGTLSGPETDLMERAADLAKKKHGLVVRVKTFQDYIMPNTALIEGSLDANMFQHEPYLLMAEQMQNIDLKVIGRTFLYPMGLYAPKLKTPKDLPAGARIGLPNDPSNLARALLLLHEHDIIFLKREAFDVTLKDVQENLRGLRFQLMDAAFLPRALADLDAAVINTNYALPAGFSPARHALVREGVDSPYANVVVVRGDQEVDERFTQLVEALHDPEVVALAEVLFEGEAVPAWRTSTP